MISRRQISIYTFLGVLISIFISGFLGVSISLDYIQNKYIELQLDVNKRQAQSMAKFLEKQLETGLSEEDVKMKLQTSIEGTETEEGFICMFNSEGAELLCHPNQEMIGMQLPAEFTFEEIAKNKTSKTSELLKTGEEIAGLFNTDTGTDIAFITPVKGTNWMLAVHENIAMIKKEISKEKKIFAVGSIILGIIIAVFATFVARLISRRYEIKIEKQNQELDKKNKDLIILNEQLKQSKEEIKSQRDEIEAQRDTVIQHRDKIQKQKDEITSSITYASRIQNALLTPENTFNQLFREYFIFFRPRNIVSGDFYWATQISDIKIIVVADCTGHGVPGAFMSMLGISFLNEIVTKDFNKKNELSASNILDKLRDNVKNSLRQTGKQNESKDGMDLTIAIIDDKNKKIQFAGANNHLIHISNNQLIQIKGDKMPIGIYIGEEKPFTNHDKEFLDNDLIYMFSDGYTDQFGAENNHKYMLKRFKNFLLKISNENLKLQKKLLEEELNNWMKNRNQIDDILVVGIKL